MPGWQPRTGCRISTERLPWSALSITLLHFCVIQSKSKIMLLSGIAYQVPHALAIISTRFLKVTHLFICSGNARTEIRYAKCVFYLVSKSPCWSECFKFCIITFQNLTKQKLETYIGVWVGIWLMVNSCLGFLDAMSSDWAWVSSLLPVQLHGDAHRPWLKCWGFCHLPGRLCGVPGSWLKQSPQVNAVSIREKIRQMENCCITKTNGKINQSVILKNE